RRALFPVHLAAAHQFSLWVARSPLPDRNSDAAAVARKALAAAALRLVAGADCRPLLRQFALPPTAAARDDHHRDLCRPTTDRIPAHPHLDPAGSVWRESGPAGDVAESRAGGC